MVIRVLAALALVVSCSAPVAASARSVCRPNLERELARSGLVFVGRFLHQRVGDMTFEVLEPLRGDAHVGQRRTVRIHRRNARPGEIWLVLAYRSRQAPWASRSRCGLTGRVDEARIARVRELLRRPDGR